MTESCGGARSIRWRSCGREWCDCDGHKPNGSPLSEPAENARLPVLSSTIKARVQEFWPALPCDSWFTNEARVADAAQCDVWPSVIELAVPYDLDRASRQAENVADIFQIVRENHHRERPAA